MGRYHYEWSTLATLLLLLGCLIHGGQSQQDFLPPVLRLDRNWNVPPTLPIGAEVTRVRAQNAGSNLLFGLEANEPPVPFRIDNSTGIVYVNDTLADKLGKSYSLWVTALDGNLEAKSEVWALVTNATGGQILPKRPKWPFLPINKSYSFNPPSLPPQIIPVPEIPTTDRVTTTAPVTSTLRTTKDIDNTPKVTESSVVDDKIDVKIDDKINASLPDDNELSNTNDVTLTVIPLVAIGCIVVIVVVVLIVLWKRNIFLKKKTKKDDISKETPGNIVLQDHALNDWNRPRAPSNTYEAWDASHCQNEIDSSLSEEKKDEWEVSRHRIRIFNIVGEGAFGQVWRATATDIDGQKGPITVAVKTMKENASEKEKQDLLLELEVMKKLNTHPNVVRLLGCCTDKEPTFVIMEFVALGKLQSFLRDSRAGRHYGNTHADSKTLTSRDLTHYAYQVARGMEFLSSNGIIHRDLAARNVLIDEERKCKVADFGFARDVAGTHVYERKSDGRLPIRWMAPESLYDDIFSVKSDIWSFGVLIWEIVTLGSTPYPGLSAADVMRRVREGHRLEKPEHCRRELYNIMYYCWEAEAASRPDFKECVSLLEKLLMSEMDYIELERFPDHSYYNVQHLDGEKL